MKRLESIMTILSALFFIGFSGNAVATQKDELLNVEGVEEIIFATRQLNDDPHWYANFGYYARNAERKAYRAKGQLCKLNLKTGKVQILLDDPEGSVRDPQVHYDGGKILFSYRRGGTDPFLLYEINSDGTNLKQLTFGKYDDIEPTYLPDGSIIFCSGRCKRWVNCWLTQVAMLYKCDGDGKNIRPISSNNDHDNTPWVLPDGRILYQRWEYVDRSQVHYHHLWTCNPDGTGQMVYYGNMHPGIVMIDAKPIPGTDNKVLAVFSPGHGRKEHCGHITVLTAKAGPDAKSSPRRIHKSSNFRDPYPFSENLFMVAHNTEILLMDGGGKIEKIYQLPGKLAQAGVQIHEPRPLRARQRERVIAPSIDLDEPNGRMVVANVYHGRNMKGVRKGDIKKLLVLESLPMPIHYSGGMTPISIGGTFTLERVVGTVPVEEDGSAYFELPALRSFFFVALDENNESVKRMQSFLTLQPGETVSCVGCHEHRTMPPVNTGKSKVSALNRMPSQVQPLRGIPDVYDFPRHIQPILDKHCVKCHGYDKWAGRVLLTGDRGPLFSQSYYTLTAHRQIADGRNQPKSNLDPRTIGAVASPLMHKIKKGHNGVKLSQHEKDMIRFWIESGASFPGTYAALGGGMIGHSYENKVIDADYEWPTTKSGAEAINRRCGNCHNEKKRMIPRALSHNAGRRHLVFNLTRPDKSLMLLMPLGKEAGGYGLCKGKKDDNGNPVDIFKDTSDGDYQKILGMITAGKKYIDKETRFDMPQFRPPMPWVREMKRYGVLAADVNPGDVIDAHAVDRKYWESFWHRKADTVQ